MRQRDDYVVKREDSEERRQTVLRRSCVAQSGRDTANLQGNVCLCRQCTRASCICVRLPSARMCVPIFLRGVYR